MKFITIKNGLLFILLLLQISVCVMSIVKSVPVFESLANAKEFAETVTQIGGEHYGQDVDFSPYTKQIHFYFTAFFTCIFSTIATVILFIKTNFSRDAISLYKEKRQEKKAEKQKKKAEKLEKQLNALKKDTE